MERSDIDYRMVCEFIWDLPGNIFRILILLTSSYGPLVLLFLGLFNLRLLCYVLECILPGTPTDYSDFSTTLPLRMLPLFVRAVSSLLYRAYHEASQIVRNVLSGFLHSTLSLLEAHKTFLLEHLYLTLTLLGYLILEVPYNLLGALPVMLRVWLPPSQNCLSEVEEQQGADENRPQRAQVQAEEVGVQQVEAHRECAQPGSARQPEAHRGPHVQQAHRHAEELRARREQAHREFAQLERARPHASFMSGMGRRAERRPYQAYVEDADDSDNDQEGEYPLRHPAQEDLL